MIRFDKSMMLACVLAVAPLACGSQVSRSDPTDNRAPDGGGTADGDGTMNGEDAHEAGPEDLGVDGGTLDGRIDAADTKSDASDSGSSQEQDVQNEVAVALHEENVDSACSDGIDNDGDGYIDCVDHDCSKNAAVSVCAGMAEATDTACSDGVDNDIDGHIDCDDYDCSKNAAVSVCVGTGEATDATCSDGVDNDIDGHIDCDDYDCSLSPYVTVCGSCAEDLGDGSCSTCVEQLCCDEGVACFFSNDACFSFAECMVTCSGPDSACLSTCESMFPTGKADFLSLRACQKTHCAAAC